MLSYGHSDNIGNKKRNQEFSRRRAETVAAFLKGRGVSPEQLTLRWFGGDLPKATNQRAEGRAVNRRVALIPMR